MVAGFAARIFGTLEDGDLKEDQSIFAMECL